MDLLALIAAEPTLIPLLAVVLFAAGMYPFGMMFGCTPCCDPCSCASGERLPDTITVTLDGFTDYSKKQIATLSFSSSCFGSGGSGTVDAPGQSAFDSDPEDDRGPITAVSLADGGSGYAKLGRIAPTVSVTGTSGSGDGATFGVTLSQSKDSCGLDRWAVSKVTITGGDGYQTGDELTFSIADGDAQEESASATVYVSRIAPTVTVSGTSGTGENATFDVTLAQSQDSNGRDQWAVSKVTMTGGTGYEQGDTLTFEVAEGDTEEIGASASLVIGRAPPTLTLNGNATTTVQTADNGDGTWRISSVTVTDGGSGWTDLAHASFSKAADDVAVTAAVARVRVVYDEPINTTFDISSPDGSAAVLQAVWQLAPSSEWPATNRRCYRLESVTVVNGGSGYAQYETISISFPSFASGRVFTPAYIDIDEVDANGAIQAVFVAPEGSPTQSPAGLYQGRRTDKLHSVILQNEQIGPPGPIFSAANVAPPVTFNNGGAYYKNDPDARTVSVTSGGTFYRENQDAKTVTISSSGGAYYREDASLPPYVADVTVTINQGAPSAGVGAVISATVGDDPQDPETFGKVTGLTVTNGGDGYLGWVWETNDCCGHYLNGQSIVLERVADSNANICGLATVPFSPGSQYFSVPVSCVYTHRFCGGWKSPFLTGPSWAQIPQRRAMQLYVGFTGEGQPAVAKLARACGAVSSDDNTGTACEQAWISEDNIETCSHFEWSATSDSGATISVSPGGSYDPEWRFAGCESTASSSCSSCNVCCQGDDESEEEVEMIIQWHPDWEPAPDFADRPICTPQNPTPCSAALSKGAAFWGSFFLPKSGTYVLQRVGTTAEWATTVSRIMYGDQLPVVHRLFARIDPCAECGDCIKKCMITTWSPNGFDLLCDFPCEGKRDCNAYTPVCTPYGEYSYSMTGSRMATYPNDRSFGLIWPNGYETRLWWPHIQWRALQASNPCEVPNTFFSWCRDNTPYTGGNKFFELLNGDYGFMEVPPPYSNFGVRTDRFTNIWKFMEQNAEVPEDFAAMYFPGSGQQPQWDWDRHRDRVLRGYSDIPWKDVVTVTIQ